MILYDWEGDPWALSIASGCGLAAAGVNKSACKTSLLGKNPDKSNHHGTLTIASQPSQFT
jgi:hypothetical protein